MNNSINSNTSTRFNGEHKEEFDKKINDFLNTLQKENKPLPTDITQILSDNVEYLYEPVPFKKD